MPTVAIVGLGLTGLVANYYLTKAGYDVKLFDARHRLGGLLNTSNYFNTMTENGGQLINSDNTNLLSILAEFDIKIIDRGIQPFSIQYINGRFTYSFNNFDMFSMSLYRLDDWKKNDSSNITLQVLLDMLDIDSGLKKLIRTAIHSQYGCELTDINANMLWNVIHLDVDNRIFELEGSIGDERYMINGGTKALINALSKGCRPYYGHQLIKVSKMDNYTKLTFNTGNEHNVEYSFSKVIIALPSSVINKSVILKNVIHTKAISTIKYGTNQKLFLYFKRPVWGNKFPTIVTAWCTVWDNMDKLQEYGEYHSLTVLFGGVDIMSSTPADILSMLGKLYKDISKEYIGYSTSTPYQVDPYALGCYAGYTGTMIPLKQGRELVFANSALSVEPRICGYMEGAVVSAKLAVRMITGRIIGDC